MSLFRVISSWISSWNCHITLWPRKKEGPRLGSFTCFSFWESRLWLISNLLEDVMETPINETHNIKRKWDQSLEDRNQKDLNSSYKFSSEFGLITHPKHYLFYQQQKEPVFRSSHCREINGMQNISKVGKKKGKFLNFCREIQFLVLFEQPKCWQVELMKEDLFSM